jgi:hypothetical protein
MKFGLKQECVSKAEERFSFVLFCIVLKMQKKKDWTSVNADRKVPERREH